MTEDVQRKGLGRGLSALLGESSEDYANLDRERAQRSVPVGRIRPGRFQPRHGLAEELVQELADSIRDKGVLQPILVRRRPDDPGGFEIIAGERRWRAAQVAGLHEIPVIVKDLADREALEVALVENLQRQDLTPLEEAEGYQRLMREYAHTQENLAKAVGKSRSHVANTMRLLGLPDPVKELVEDGSLSAGHARALLNAVDPEGLARHVVAAGLNVRQTERLASRREAPPSGARPAPAKDADTAALERDLTNRLGLRVEIRNRRKGGAITFHFRTLEQLDDLLRRLTEVGHGQPAGEAAAAPAGKRPMPPIDPETLRTARRIALKPLPKN